MTRDEVKFLIPPNVMRESNRAFVRLQRSKDGEWAKRWKMWHDTITTRPDFQSWYDQFLSAEDERFTAYVAALSAVTVHTKRATIKQFLAIMEKEHAL